MELVCKILFCGDGAVGKTSIRRKYVGSEVNSTYLMTIGADLSIIPIQLTYKKEDYHIKAYLMDLAGQPSFKFVRKMYYKGGSAAFLVYDSTNRQSFVNIEKWANEIKENNPLFPIPMVLVANKTDLKDPNDTAHVTTIEGQELARILSFTYYSGKNWDIPYIETSAITGDNIHKAFQSITELLIDTNLTSPSSN